MEIIPVINCPDAESVSERAEKISGFAKWAHIDVSDAAFTFNKSWGNASEWPKIGQNLNLEIHLMVENPEKEIDSWLRIGAKRIIVHLETINEETFTEMRKKTDREKVQLMVAINPETPVSKLGIFLKKAYAFQLLAVYPGPSGQKFQPIVIDKIKFLRSERPDAIIEVDGGINEEVAKICKTAGANILTASSYIFNSPDPKASYEKLSAI